MTTQESDSDTVGGSMPTRRTQPGRGRYSLDECVLEIARMRDHLGLQDKEIALAVGISPPQFSHKMANAGKSSFNVDELGRIAAFFAERTGRQLLGWPFVTSKECEFVERLISAAGGTHKNQ